MTLLSRVIATAAAATALAAGMSVPVQADSYQFLNAQELEQTVLRAQMPRTLGSWNQNYYFTMKDPSSTRATVCWNASGDVRLPAAKNMGAVAYAVSQDVIGTVSVYQFATAAKASAALAALRKADCADSPTITTDEGEKVAADSGSDFLDSSTTGLGAALSYPQGDKILLTNLRTTQIGLAVVQTEIQRAVAKTMSSTGQQQAAGRLGSVNTAWHKSVVRTYDGFGQGNSR